MLQFEEALAQAAMRRRVREDRRRKTLDRALAQTSKGRGDGWIICLPGTNGGRTIYVRGLTPKGVIRYTIDPDLAFLFSDSGFAQGLASLLAQAYPAARLERMEVAAYFGTRGEGE